MDISEMKKAKRALEGNITTLLREFEKSTQVSVRSVNLDHNMSIGKTTPQVISTHIEVEL